MTNKPDNRTNSPIDLVGFRKTIFWCGRETIRQVAMAEHLVERFGKKQVSIDSKIYEKIKTALREAGFGVRYGISIRGAKLKPYSER